MIFFVIFFKAEIFVYSTTKYIPGVMLDRREDVEFHDLHNQLYIYVNKYILCISLCKYLSECKFVVSKLDGRCVEENLSMCPS